MVRAELLPDTGRKTVRGHLIPLDEDEAPLEVRPFDAWRLEVRCQQLFEMKFARRFSATAAPPQGIPVSAALMSVRHDVVLPYLDFMARRQHSLAACEAIARLGTPRAEALLAALAERTDETGEVARKAMEKRAEAASAGPRLP